MPRRTHQQRRRTQRHKTVLHGNGRHRSNDFRCVGCRHDVSLDAPGSAHRNHCPNCLVSLHVDRHVPGDRAEGCHGRMEALSLTTRADGEWMIIHQCLACDGLSANRIAGDDNALALMRLALKPLQDRQIARALITTL